jgi:2-dehydro-3-deoxyphosphogluconate aldolase/(4S)-4-hydroxy-2-oxoglutarate aldolase
MIAKTKLLQSISESGIIAVLRHLPSEHAEAIAESLISGGVTALEVTIDSPGALESIRKLSAAFGDQAIVGAGTVIDAESARLAILHGAEFVFSPSLHRDVISTTLRYGKVAVPGVMTPTEMITALEWGADMVKLFPAAALGPRYIKDVGAPLPQVPIIPTGGITLDNIAPFFAAGACAVGIGGNLVSIREGQVPDFSRMRELASQYSAAVKQARS